MSGLTIKFPCDQDLLYVRGDQTFEFLYVHLGDEDSADFVAYFDSLQSNIPIVYSLSKVEIPSYTVVSNEDFMDKELLHDNLKANNWQSVGMINTILPGSWKRVFCIVRDEIIKNNNKQKG